MSRKQSPLFREDALGSTSLVWTCRRPGIAHKYTDRWFITDSSDYHCQHAWIIVLGVSVATMCQPSLFDPGHVCTCSCSTNIFILDMFQIPTYEWSQESMQFIIHLSKNKLKGPWWLGISLALQVIRAETRGYSKATLSTPSGWNS